MKAAVAAVLGIPVSPNWAVADVSGDLCVARFSNLGVLPHYRDLYRVVVDVKVRQVVCSSGGYPVPLSFPAAQASEGSLALPAAEASEELRYWPEFDGPKVSAFLHDGVLRFASSNKLDPLSVWGDAPPLIEVCRALCPPAAELFAPGARYSPWAYHFTLVDERFFTGTRLAPARPFAVFDGVTKVFEPAAAPAVWEGVEGRDLAPEAAERPSRSFPTTDAIDASGAFGVGVLEPREFTWAEAAEFVRAGFHAASFPKPRPAEAGRWAEVIQEVEAEFPALGAAPKPRRGKARAPGAPRAPEEPTAEAGSAEPSAAAAAKVSPLQLPGERVVARNGAGVPHLITPASYALRVEIASFDPIVEHRFYELSDETASADTLAERFLPLRPLGDAEARALVEGRALAFPEAASALPKRDDRLRIVWANYLWALPLGRREKALPLCAGFLEERGLVVAWLREVSALPAEDPAWANLYSESVALIVAARDYGRTNWRAHAREELHGTRLGVAARIEQDVKKLRGAELYRLARNRRLFEQAKTSDKIAAILPIAVKRQAKK